jgi:glycosyltransferase involved in cell wall biosynthesis
MRADARELIARSQLMVFTSESEGLSLAALEALDAGVPVLAPAVAGMRALLGEGSGVLLADTRPETIADAAAALLEDREHAGAMGAAGRALVRERYAPARMHAAYDALYADVLAAR